jgi:hypothetical protein
VNPLLGARQPVPAVVPEVDREGLGEEEEGVHPVRREEDRRHVRPKLRVVADEQEQEEGAQEGGGGERGERQLDQLVREPVVLGVTRAPADDLDDHGEDRDAEDERGEVQMELRHGPDREAGPEHRELAVRRLLRSLLRERGKRRQHEEGAREDERCRYGFRKRLSRERRKTLSEA